MTLINRFLSALGWKCDEPAINHYGWSGNPKPVPVPRYKIPYGYSPSEVFPNEVYEITDKKAKLAVALYREARSLDNVPFQFLSYFKILNIFWSDKKKNGNKFTPTIALRRIAIPLRGIGRNAVAGLMSGIFPVQRRGRTAGTTSRDHCANKFALVAQVIQRPRYQIERSK